MDVFVQEFVVLARFHSVIIGGLVGFNYEMVVAIDLLDVFTQFALEIGCSNSTLLISSVILHSKSFNSSITGGARLELNPYDFGSLILGVTCGLSIACCGLVFSISSFS